MAPKRYRLPVADPRSGAELSALVEGIERARIRVHGHRTALLRRLIG